MGLGGVRAILSRSEAGAEDCRRADRSQKSGPGPWARVRDGCGRGLGAFRY